MTTTAVDRFSDRYKGNVFHALWIGQIVSVIGSGLTGFALRVWAFEHTHSVTQFALITFFTLFRECWRPRWQV